MKVFIIAVAFFITSFITILWNRNNIIKIFIGVELGLLASSWIFIYGFCQLGLVDGAVSVLFILAVAAAEASVGLGLAVSVFLKHGSLDLQKILTMEG
jgi:NADH-quinone oxidoreductase subunit K